ncbi:tyrosine-type recombinase/integrase [Megamonas funiformis]|uniref:site-specific integrase n=1 Tax=Megamonas funiformis TaxID=437897 RepID=UPI002941E632|nr:tyrosine-type recombinase/integrase [Megamonas funiformis]
MATQGKILVYKRQGKKGTTYTYRLEAGRDPITGKRKRVSKSGFKTAKEARAAAQPILNKLLLGQNIVESNITFDEYANEWIKEYSLHLKKTTIISLKRTIIIGCKYFSGIKLKDITTYDYQQFINNFAINKQKNTVIRLHSVMKSLFKTAIRYSIININPANNIIMPKFVIQKKDIDTLYLTKQELLEFLKFAKTYKGYYSNYFYPMCMVFAYTGIRLGEACALIWENIDLKNKTIYIDSSLVATSYNDFERQATPKNESSIRTIFIDDILVSELKKWKHEQLLLRILYGTKDKRTTENFVFTKYLKGKDFEYPIIPLTFQMLISKISKKYFSHFNKNIHAHMFRHTHASLLAEAGIPLEVIQERLGHSNDIITKRIYLHITKKTKLNAVKKFEEYMYK